MQISAVLTFGALPSRKLGLVARSFGTLISATPIFGMRVCKASICATLYFAAQISAERVFQAPTFATLTCGSPNSTMSISEMPSSSGPILAKQTSMKPG